MTSENHRKKWTKEEDQKLIALLYSGMIISDVCKELKRSDGAIIRRIKIIICEMYIGGKTIEEIEFSICLSRSFVLNVIQNQYKKNPIKKEEILEILKTANEHIEKATNMLSQINTFDFREDIILNVKLLNENVRKLILSID